MRKTLSLTAGALAAVTSHATAQEISLRKAASELILRGASIQLPVKKARGIPVFQVPGNLPRITTEQVRVLAEEG